MFTGREGAPMATEFPFQRPSESNKYCVFPADLEMDSNVFFHGTAYGNLEPILQVGFKPKPPLESVSFSNQSNLCMNYACRSRSKASPNGVVIAVRFPSLDGRKVVYEQWGIYLYELEFQPQVIGYCVVPPEYEFR